MTQLLKFSFLSFMSIVVNIILVVVIKISSKLLEAFSQTSLSITDQSPNDFASPVFTTTSFTVYKFKVGNQGLNHKLSYSKKKRTWKIKAPV